MTMPWRPSRSSPAATCREPSGSPMPSCLAVAHDRTFKDGRIRNAYRAGARRRPAPSSCRAGGTPRQTLGRGRLPGRHGHRQRRLGGAGAAQPACCDRTRRLSCDGIARCLAGSGPTRPTAPGPAGYAGGASGFDGAQQTLKLEVDRAQHRRRGGGRLDAPRSPAIRRTADMAPDRHGVRGLAVPARAGLFPARHAARRVRCRSDANSPSTCSSGPSSASRTRRRPGAGRSASPTHHLRRGDGMTFAGIGPNRWTEGTGASRPDVPDVGADAIADGSARRACRPMPHPRAFSTRPAPARLPTGLPVEAQGGGAFNYYHRPHLGATAWAALAAERWNPFTGKRIGTMTSAPLRTPRARSRRTSASCLAAVVMARALDPLRAADRLLFGAVTATLIGAYAAWRWTDTLPRFELSFGSVWQHALSGVRGHRHPLHADVDRDPAPPCRPFGDGGCRRGKARSERRMAGRRRLHLHLQRAARRA